MYVFSANRLVATTFSPSSCFLYFFSSSSASRREISDSATTRYFSSSCSTAIASSAWPTIASHTRLYVIDGFTARLFSTLTAPAYSRRSPPLYIFSTVSSVPMPSFVASWIWLFSATVFAISASTAAVSTDVFLMYAPISATMVLTTLWLLSSAA